MVHRVSEYISELGDDFMSWNMWAMTTLSAEDLKDYLDDAGPDEPVSPAKHALHQRWVVEQKITTHIMYEDGVEVGRTEYK